MTKPLCIDLFCGLGGWTEGFLAEGFDVIGFDIEQHVYGEERYPAQLVLQDVRTIHGSQFKDAAIIVASSPCQAYSYMAMPWKRAKQIAAALRGDGAFPEGYRGAQTIAELNELFAQPARIQREACEAAGRFIPMIQENVKGAQPWVGPAQWRYGSFYLWGDVPALMPVPHKAVKVTTMGAGWYPPGHPKHVAGFAFNTHADRATKNAGGSWFNVAHNTTSGKGQNPDGRKVPDRIVHQRDGHAHTRHLTNPAEHSGVKQGGSWFHDSREHTLRRHSSASTARKAASARIAKIPVPARSLHRRSRARHLSDACRMIATPNCPNCGGEVKPSTQGDCLICQRCGRHHLDHPATKRQDGAA